MHGVCVHANVGNTLCMIADMGCLPGCMSALINLGKGQRWCCPPSTELSLYLYFFNFSTKSRDAGLCWCGGWSDSWGVFHFDIPKCCPFTVSSKKPAVPIRNATAFFLFFYRQSLSKCIRDHLCPPLPVNIAQRDGVEEGEDPCSALTCVGTFRYITPLHLSQKRGSGTLRTERA